MAGNIQNYDFIEVVEIVCPCGYWWLVPKHVASEESVVCGRCKEAFVNDEAKLKVIKNAEGIRQTI